MIDIGRQIPDLTSRFPYVFSRPMPHSMGQNVPSDWSDKPDDDPQFGIYKRCGCWTEEERGILFQIALHFQGQWLDLGSHTCITTAYIAAAGNPVIAVDPMYRVEEFEHRASLNLETVGMSERVMLVAGTADEFFGNPVPNLFVGASVDGDHCHPCPMNDSLNAHRCLTDNGVIILHDAFGEPVYSAARALMDMGYRARFYSTCHGLIACTRSRDFVFPEHTPDPRINWARMRDSMKGFPLSRCE